MKVRPSATQVSDRIGSLDLIRGIAVLGILLMNISSFSQVGQAYLNPTLSAGIEGINRYIWDFSYLFANGRFMALFSILFGAGIVLFSNRASDKNIQPSMWFYRRIGLLFCFGMIHAYLIWMGDILVAYSICGAWIFLIRNKSIRVLSILAGVLFLIPIMFNLSTYYFMPDAELQEIFSFYYPDETVIQNQINAYRGGYFGQMQMRFLGALELQTHIFFMNHFWKISAQMILGVILFRTGVLSNKGSDKLYKRMAALGICLGFIISFAGLAHSHAADWPGPFILCITESSNYLASLIMAIGYIGLITLWARSTFLSSFKNLLSKAGRMAFTHYILMSLLCTFIFYGHGLALFETMDRVQQYTIVIIVWFIILVASHLILNTFRQGPLEWFWRRLTYGNLSKN